MLKENEKNYTIALLIGALIGALLGAGMAFMLVKAPAKLAPGENPGDIKTGDILELTNTATRLLRQLDDIRRKT